MIALAGRTIAPTRRLVGPRLRRSVEVPAVAGSYDALVPQLIERRHALALTQAELDARVGWPDGYAGKAELPPGRSGRRRPKSWSTFTAWLEALQAALVLAPLPAGAPMVPDAPPDQYEHPIDVTLRTLKPLRLGVAVVPRGGASR
jgi:hypothetical protein